MAKWEIEEEPRERNCIYLRLLRDGSMVGSVGGFIAESAAGQKYFEGRDIWIKKEYQEEYMKAHEGAKMGEALGLELLNSLKREGVSYLLPEGLSPHGRRFFNGVISTGMIENTFRGLWKIKWENLPATEEATKKMTAKIRAKEARAAKIKRAIEWVGRTARKFRKPRPR